MPTPLQELELGQSLHPPIPLKHMTPEDVLKSVHGFETFHPGQKEAIVSMLDGNDTIVLIPTG